MNKRIETPPKDRFVLILVAFGVLGLGALGSYVAVNPKASKVENSTKATVAEVLPSATTLDAKPKANVAPVLKAKVTVYKLVNGEAKATNTKLLPKGTDAAVYALTQSLMISDYADVKVLGVDIQQGTALVDFGTTLDTGFGSLEESELLKLIQTTLGQFPEIAKFQPMSEGQPVKEMGHFEFTEPLPVIRSAVIAPST